MLWLYYAALKPADATLLITINSVGTVVEMVYIVLFTVYATNDARVYSPITYPNARNHKIVKGSLFLQIH